MTDRSRGRARRERVARGAARGAARLRALSLSLSSPLANRSRARCPNLLGALAHLPALALEAAGALLLPLPPHLRVRLLPRVGLVAHAATQAQHEVQRRLLLDVVIRERAPVLKLLAGEDQALLVGRDALLVLDLGLNVVDGVRGLHRQR